MTRRVFKNAADARNRAATVRERQMRNGRVRLPPARSLTVAALL